MKCEYPDCLEPVAHTLPPDPDRSRSWTRHVCAVHRGEEIDSHLRFGDPKCICEHHGKKNMNKFSELLTAINRARVLRSSCEESRGAFRVHLAEPEWDEIARLAEECAREGSK